MNNLAGKLLTCIINFVEGFAVHAEDKRQKSYAKGISHGDPYGTFGKSELFA